jgi:hypothetical protein
MDDIDNLKKYINIINYVIKKIENNNDINDEIIKTVCLNVNENICKIKNILAKKNLEKDIDDSDNESTDDGSTENNIYDNINDSDGQSIEDEFHCEKDDDEGKGDIIYYQKFPNQKRKLEIFNKTIFIF